MFNPDDFTRQYRWEMISAYSVISGVPDIHEASEDERAEGFRRILAARNLRSTHELWLADQVRAHA
jgi:hypothetical protein